MNLHRIMFIVSSVVALFVMRDINSHRHSKHERSSPVVDAKLASAIASRPLPAERTQTNKLIIVSTKVDTRVVPVDPVEVAADINEAESEDETQSAKVEDVIEDIDSVRTAWWTYREHVFDELNLDEDLRKGMQDTREKTRVSFENLADRLREANDDKKQDLVEAMVQIRQNYEAYTRAVLGESRFDYLKQAQDEFNEQVSGQTNYKSRVSGDW